MSEKSLQKVLIDGNWVESDACASFQAFNPSDYTSIEVDFPVSSWNDCDRVLAAAQVAAEELRKLPSSQIAEFLEAYADGIDASLDALSEVAFRETGLPVEPRLAKVEGPRTSGQLRQAAAAARNGTWAQPTIDTAAGIRSCYEAIGPVCVFGPNNFPFAFGSVSGGDFAAAIAAGNPVIGKANTSHPETTLKLAELAKSAVEKSGLPAATVQLIYRMSHEDGKRFVQDPRLGAVGYTGSRGAGLALKSAADEVGKPIYLELSSVNPVVLLPGALEERGEEILNEFVTSVLMGTGQFCTNPGLILALNDAHTRKFSEAVVEKFATDPGTLLSMSVKSSLTAALQTLVDAGAELLCGGSAVEDKCSVTNSLLRVDAAKFLNDPEVFQTEAFGNASLIVVGDTAEQLVQVAAALEGNLTGCVYSASDGADDANYDLIAPVLATRVGRVLNDKMPTGVAVSPAMNHGGPFPATGHPGSTAVGIPASISRFSKLTCYDGVRPHRLPQILQDKNHLGGYRFIDLQWTQADV
ncbi:MAG: aldehyde dehydrogenase (NADP(+)) [Planctomycetota bacterium]